MPSGATGAAGLRENENARAEDGLQRPEIGARSSESRPASRPDPIGGDEAAADSGAAESPEGRGANGPLRVLHVETGRHRYGGARQVELLLTGLAERGLDNALVCEEASAIAEAAAELPVRVHALRRAAGPGLALHVWRLVRRERPDVVHIHSRRGADDFGALGARLAGARVVLSRRVDNRQPRWLVFFKHRLYDRVIAISKAIRRVLLADGVPRAKIACVRSAHAPPAEPASAPGAGLRAGHGIPADAPVIAMAAQMIARKGHRDLLDAMPAIRAAHPRAVAVLLGRGPLEDELRARVAAEGLDDAVAFAGFRADLSSLWSEIDLLVHPAHREGLGVALLEAAAAGVPIVAARAGGVPEVVLDGVNGRLVPPGDAAALAAAVNELIADPQPRRVLGETGRRVVAERFSVERMVAGNLRVYRAIAASSRAEP